MPKVLAFVAALVAGVAAQAATQPLRITFDGNVQSDFRRGVFEAGLRFTGPLSTTMVTYPWVNSQGASNGTPTLLSYAYPMTMARRDGQPFTLQALDIGWYWLPEGQSSAQVMATLLRPDGSIGTRELDLPLGDFRSWQFGETVTQVTFGQPYFTHLRYDNVDLLVPAPVPEAQTAWLALLGLAGLAAWRRVVRPARPARPARR